MIIILVSLIRYITTTDLFHGLIRLTSMSVLSLDDAIVCGDKTNMVESPRSP